MTIFTNADLDDFSALATDLALKDDCDILRETSHTDDSEGGESSVVWSTAATVKCMLTDDSQTPTESVVAGRLDGRTLQKVWFPRGTDVRKTDRLRINGTTYHIMDASTNSYEVLKAVEVWREF
jgi:uncharacterized protein YabE (DUF348 family)